MTKPSVFWFLCQAEKTRAVDLLSELEGSIWVARSWVFSFSWKISERGHTLNQTASSAVFFDLLICQGLVVASVKHVFG